MAQLQKLSLGAGVMLLSTLACGLLKPPTSTQTPISATIEEPTLEPIQTLVPTDPPIPPPNPTETAVQLPTQLPTQPLVEKGVFQRITALPAPLPDSYSEIQVGAPTDGTAWIITSQGAQRWDNMSWEAMLSEEEGGLASVDDRGRLWALLLNTGEIAAWLNGDWTSYGEKSGWTEPPTAAEMGWWTLASWRAYTDSAGIVWLPTSRDVRLFDGEQWSLFTLEDMGFPLPEMEDLGVIHRLAMGGDGTETWVGECYYGGPGPMGGQGVRWFDGETWHGSDAPVDSTCVSTITADPAGNVWLGAYDTIWRYGYADQSWTSTNLPEAFLDDFNFAYPRQLIVDGNGDAWVMMELCGGASCSGPVQVYRIHAGEWSLIREAPYWDLPLKHLAVDGSGQGWLFWDGEVYQLGEESLESAASIIARGVGANPDGKLWVVAEEEGGAALWMLQP